MIRPLEVRDRAPVLHLLAATQRFTPAEIDVAAELIDVVLTRPDQRDYHAFVWCTDAQPIGVLIVGPAAATAGTWHMYWIAAHPAYHGKGVGAALAAHAERFIRERGGYLIVVETSSQPAYERTRRFYAKHGYTEVARVPDYYRPGDDLVLLTRRIA